MSLLDSTKCHDQDTLIEGLGRPGQVASCLAQLGERLLDHLVVSTIKWKSGRYRFESCSSTTERRNKMTEDNLMLG